MVKLTYQILENKVSAYPPQGNCIACPSKCRKKRSYQSHALNLPICTAILSLKPCYNALRSRFRFECIATRLRKTPIARWRQGTLAPPNEKVYTRSEHIHEVDNAFHEGNHEGYQEGYSEGYNEGVGCWTIFPWVHSELGRIQRKMKQENAWQDQRT